VRRGPATNGVVVEEGAQAQQTARWRPPGRLRLDPSAGAVLAFSLGPEQLRVSVANLDMRVLAERSGALDPDAPAAVSLDRAAALAEQALAAAGVDIGAVIGAAAAIPGVIGRDGTVVACSALRGWTGVAAGDELARRIGVPVDVENDANLAALAELRRGAAVGAADVVYVKASTGIGAALVLGGRLHRGAAGAAGELGHVQVRAGGAVCRCGSRGCLETVAAVPALLDALEPLHGPNLGVDELLALVAAGDPGTRRVVKDAARALGRALADVCTHLNPALVVVGGELAGAGEPYLRWVRLAVEHWAQPSAVEAVEVVPGALGPHAETLGALALAARAVQV
jgi:predicted NBD/HSP70 family sugar kinase